MSYVYHKLTKICSICGEDKPKSDFYVFKSGYLYGPCKDCNKNIKTKYIFENKDKIKKSKQVYDKKRYRCNREKELLRHKKYREKNAQKIYNKHREYFSNPLNKKKNNEWQKQWRIDNREHLLEWRRENRKKNIDKIRKRRKMYYVKNKEKINQYRSRKYRTDADFRIAKLLRGRLRQALKTNPKRSSAIDLLGCSLAYFKKYFRNKFTKAMTWDLFMLGKIHIDHIIPCKHFDLTKLVNQKKCFHYTNLQPLWPKDNLVKGAKLVQRMVA